MGFTVSATLRSTRQGWALVSGQGHCTTLPRAFFSSQRICHVESHVRSDANPVTQDTLFSGGTFEWTSWACWAGREELGFRTLLLARPHLGAYSRAGPRSTGSPLRSHFWDSVSDIWDGLIFTKSIFLISKRAPLKKRQDLSSRMVMF